VAELGKMPKSQRGRLMATDDDEPVTTSPFESTATQRAVVGHETAAIDWPVSTVAGADQAVAPPAGLLDTTSSPLPSTARQNDAIGHEIELNQVEST